MKISRVDFESLKAMFIKSTNSDYKILEVDKSCTDSELKKAYRDLAKKHKPKMIIAGFSAFSGIIDWKIFRDIADNTSKTNELLGKK